VRFWQERHKAHPDYELVESWIQQKEKQMMEEIQTHKIRRKREEINLLVDKSARESGLRDRNLIEMVRAETLKFYGISQAED